MSIEFPSQGPAPAKKTPATTNPPAPSNPNSPGAVTSAPEMFIMNFDGLEYVPFS